MSAATPSALPVPDDPPPRPQKPPETTADTNDDEPILSQTMLRFPEPKLRLKCEDLNHVGASIFFRAVDPSRCLWDAAHAVFTSLYGPHRYRSSIPQTRSVTLILLPMPGVADTGGILLDNDHKRMRFSLDYIHNVQKTTPHRVDQEIKGVLVHEMVHAWQWNGQGKASSGLIEGIADFVRLKAGLAPPHWKQVVPDDWDAGYQHTAYFLDWLEKTQRKSLVRDINAALRRVQYVESEFWPALCGKSVHALFEDYKTYLHGESDSNKTTDPEPSMGDSGFWDLVRREKGAEQAILLKAVWRTCKDGTGLAGNQRDVLQSLQELWPKYLQSECHRERIPGGDAEKQAVGDRKG